MFDHITYDQGEVRLDPGDIIVVFSDGVSEALSAAGDEFGEPRLQEVVQRDFHADPQVLLERVLEAVRDFTKGAVQNDDVTAMIVRYSGTAGA
jgi:sigma-B regulation protein RsbU (phosphoserine phosphatase)